jgi:hypothetical protein
MGKDCSYLDAISIYQGGKTDRNFSPLDRPPRFLVSQLFSTSSMICRPFRNNRTHLEFLSFLFRKIFHSNNEELFSMKENYNNPFLSFSRFFSFGNKRIAVTFTSAFYCRKKSSSSNLETEEKFHSLLNGFLCIHNM